jgi:tetratricopeptide (TPR) repeat protein
MAQDPAVARKHWDAAAQSYLQYRKLKPSDRTALTGLASVYDATGDSARANGIYDSIMAQADSMSALDLFSTGIALFRNQNLQQAAKAFELTLKKNPYYRDALFNLCSTYLSLGSTRDTAASRLVGQRMLPVARRLVEVDGYNQNTLKMLALAFQYLNEQDSVFLMLQAAEDLPFEVRVDAFQPTQGGYSLKGAVRALRSQMIKDSIIKDSTRLADLEKTLASGKDPKTGRPLPVAIKQALEGQRPVLQQRLADMRKPVTVPNIRFEFLDAAGAPITSGTVDGGVMPADTSKDFALTPTGEGIASWRYKAGT